MTKSWTVAVALSVTLHVCLVAGFSQPHLIGGDSVRESMLARMLPTAAAPANPPAPVAKAVDPPRRNAAATESTAKTQLLASSENPVPSRGLAEAIAQVATPASDTEISLPSAPQYHAVAGLDSAPRALSNIDPEYPEEAGSIEGTVLLRLLISSTGEVDDVAVVTATPPGFFEASAMSAFSKAKFSPGYFLGIPVKSQLFIEVGYTPINRGTAVSGQSH